MPGASLFTERQGISNRVNQIRYSPNPNPHSSDNMSV
jgi:hypothetical protein